MQHTEMSALVRKKLTERSRALHKLFVSHPHEAGESYLAHLWFTTQMGARFAFVSFVILMHGIFPFLFTRTAGIQIDKLYLIMKSRIPKARLDEMENQSESYRVPHSAALAGGVRLAVIGGGFSGVSTLLQLVRGCRRPMTIDWFDESKGVGRGVAYGTECLEHLLNVPAGKMGAEADDIEGFYRWLTSPEGMQAAKPYLNGATVTAESFIPRKVYALYLESLIEQIKLLAGQNFIQLNIHHASVVNATLAHEHSQQLWLTTSEEGAPEILADAVVLATGNLPPAQRFRSAGIAGESRYINDFWAVPDVKALLSPLPAASRIVIIGTGLTMIDVVLALKAAGFEGEITAISRGGRLPCEHKAHKPYPSWSWTSDPASAPRTVRELLQGLRAEVKRAQRKGYDWRAVIDSLRPVTHILWHQLPVQQRRRFFLRLSTLWNVHRHRMAPEIGARINALMADGQVQVQSGSIYHVASSQNGLSVSFRERSSQREVTLQPALVINCSGPVMDIANCQHALLRRLRDRELITVGPLRVGIEVNKNGSAKGNAQESLFPVGPLLASEYLECTAVPELRGVAAQVAKEVLAHVDRITQHAAPQDAYFGEWI